MLLLKNTFWLIMLSNSGRWSVPSTTSKQTFEQIEVTQEVILPEVSKLNESVMNKSKTLSTKTTTE